MSFRITLAALILLVTVSAAQAQAPQTQTPAAGGSSKMDCSTNSGIKLDQSSLYNSMDTNKDGKVSKAEWTAIGAPENIYTHGAQNSKDGILLLEALNATSPPDSVDANKDGKLTLSEFKVFLKACTGDAAQENSAQGGAPQGGAPQGGAPQGGAPQK